MPCEFRMPYLLSVKYHNIQLRGSLQCIILRNVSLTNKAITWYWKLPGFRQRLFEKKNTFEQFRVPRMSHADVSVCSTNWTTVFTAPRYRRTKQSVRNTTNIQRWQPPRYHTRYSLHVKQDHNKSAVPTICWKSHNKILPLHSWNLPQRIKPRCAKLRPNCKSGPEIHKNHKVWKYIKQLFLNTRMHYLLLIGGTCVFLTEKI
jgi:hypothetical protein